MNDNVITTVKEYVHESFNLPVIRTERIGRATYYDPNRECRVEADQYITLDFGKKLGTIHIFGVCPDGITYAEFWDINNPPSQRLMKTAGRVHLDTLARRAEATEAG